MAIEGIARRSAVTPERWQQVTEIFHAALARDPRTAPTFVAEACAGDEQLRREVASMLAQPMATDGFLDRLPFQEHRRMTG